MVDGTIDVKCEFCGATYVFDEAALTALFHD
jgi:redox-regulated HSP33 family molecular chaperone